jgi:hypothetical protein
MNSEVASIFLALKLDRTSLKNQVNSAANESGNSFASKFATTMGNVFRYKLASSILTTVQGIWNYWSDGAEAAYEVQLAAEAKLTEVMKTRMAATKEEIQSIKDYASELQGIGIIGDEVTLAGASQLATYLSSTESLKSLMAAMNNLAVSNSGSFSASDTTSVANMIGKAIANDSISSLTRVGITFTDEEKSRWDTLTTEEQKAAFLSEVIKNNVGEINEAFAKTTAGQLTQMSNYAGDIKEKVGNIKEDLKANFIPLINKILGAFEAAIDKAQLFTDAFGKFMEDMGWKTSNGELEEYKENINGATKAINEQQEALESVGTAGFDVFNLLGSGLLSNTEDVDTFVGEAAAINANDSKDNPDENPYKKFFQKIEIFIKDNKERWEDFKRTVSSVWNGILEVFTPVWQNLKEKTLELMEKHLGPLGESFGHLFTSWSELWDMVDGNDWLSSTFNTFVDGLVITLDLVLSYIEQIIGALGGAADFFMDPSGYINEHIVKPFNKLGYLEEQWYSEMENQGYNPTGVITYAPIIESRNATSSGHSTVRLDEGTINSLATEISKRSSGHNTITSVYLDGKKITDSVTSNINKANKYNNRPGLRKF